MVVSGQPPWERGAVGGQPPEEGEWGEPPWEMDCRTRELQMSGLDTEVSEACEEPLVMQCQTRGEAFPALRRMGLPEVPVCRVTVRLGSEGDVFAETCVDSGASFTLLGKSKYDEASEVLGPLRSTNVRLNGAGGKEISLDGEVTAQFWVGDTRYKYVFLVGDLQGVDLLLGLDWMRAVGAVVNFATMKAVFGPTQEVQLRAHKPNNGVGFVRVHGTNTLVAGHTTKVWCTVTGGWTPKTPAVFEGHVNIGPGIHMPHAVVQPDPTTGQVVLGLVNMTTQDCILEHGVLLGRLESLREREEEDSDSDTPSTFRHGVWNVAFYENPPLKPDDEKEGGVSGSPEGMAPSRASEQVMNRGVRDDDLTSERASAPEPGGSGAEVGSDELVPICTVYNCQGSGIPGLGGNSLENVVLPEGKRRRWIAPLLRDASDVLWNSPASINQVEKDRKYDNNSPVASLPEHMRCMLPPPGSLSDCQLQQAVQLIQKYMDIFVGQMEK